MNRLKTSDISLNTLSLTDYKMINPQLAKVVIAYTGDHDKNTVAASIGRKLNYQAQAVENSFRSVQEGVAVGFVRANREVRIVKSDNELRASYTVMSSNILMDQSDESLWEMKQGAGGRYLARTQEEDLSNLIEASSNPRHDVVKLRNMALAAAARHEFLAYVDDSGTTDYGFCVAASADKMRVVSYSTRTPIVIESSNLVSVHQVKIKRSTHNQIVASNISRQDKDQSIEYYKKLFNYDKNYLDDIINFIETDAVA